MSVASMPVLHPVRHTAAGRLPNPFAGDPHCRVCSCAIPETSEKEKKVAVYKALHETHTMKAHHAVHIISEHDDRHSPHAHDTPVQHKDDADKHCAHSPVFSHAQESPGEKPLFLTVIASKGQTLLQMGAHCICSTEYAVLRDELTVEWMKGMEVWTWGMWNCECVPHFLVSKTPVQAYILDPDAPANGSQNDPARFSPSTSPSGTVPAAEIMS
ncbi:hypothetical protein B0H10DRAFT_1944451 [Mycena sp. CBHHK59/15]|nr:hypothetical protein B0H10DRAFT_1944451 [Mycena sp. CBHHK59/15]